MDIDTLLRTKHWMQAAIPDPTSKNIHTQLGVHLEEISEMLQELSTQDAFVAAHLNIAFTSVRLLSVMLKQSDNLITIDDREKYLDSLCDQIVTAVGCAHNSRMDIVGAMKEVNRSNFSKFDTDGNPFFDENQKIIKGPNYSKADLKPFV